MSGNPLDEGCLSGQDQEDSIDWTAAFDSIGTNLENDEDNYYEDFSSINPLPISTKDVKHGGQHVIDSKNLPAVYNKKKRFHGASTSPMDGYSVYSQYLLKELRCGSRESNLSSSAFTNFVYKKWRSLTKKEREFFELQASRGRKSDRHDINQDVDDRLNGVARKKDMTDHQGISRDAKYASAVFEQTAYVNSRPPYRNLNASQRNQKQPPVMSGSETPHFRELFALPQRYKSNPYYSGMKHSFVIAPQVRLPFDGIDGSRTLAPGSEICLRDHQTGRMKSYTVHYSMVTMPREEANDYLTKLAGNT